MRGLLYQGTGNKRNSNVSVVSVGLMCNLYNNVYIFLHCPRVISPKISIHSGVGRHPLHFRDLRPHPFFNPVLVLTSSTHPMFPDCILQK